MEELKKKIVKNIQLAQQGKVYYEDLFERENPLNVENQFLFFIKPELTIRSGTINIQAILDLIFRKIEKHRLSVINCKLLSAKYLEDYNIIAGHYGVINKIATNALANISEGGKQKFRSVFNQEIEDVDVLGGMEFIEKYREFSPAALDYLWQNMNMHKLAGGTYVVKLNLDGRQIFLINGFHPRQLDHFTQPGRSIIVFTLSGDLEWQVARNGFIGKTNPNDAEAGSIRNELLLRKDELGLINVSSSWNGVHLSAGPVEGLVELIRYNSDYSKKNVIQAEDYSFGKKLIETFGRETMEKILNNTNLKVDGSVISVFDLTEEKNSDEALNILKQAMNQI